MPSNPTQPNQRICFQVIIIQVCQILWDCFLVTLYSIDHVYNFRDIFISIWRTKCHPCWQCVFTFVEKKKTWYFEEYIFLRWYSSIDIEKKLSKNHCSFFFLQIFHEKPCLISKCNVLYGSGDDYQIKWLIHSASNPFFLCLGEGRTI